MKNSGEKIFSRNKLIILLITSMAVYVIVTVFIVLLYRNSGLNKTAARILQNGMYAAIFTFSLILMRIIGKSFSHYGLFFRKFLLQLLFGLCIGIGLTLFMMLFGKLPSFPEAPVYTVFSQLIVGISEETFFRGYLLSSLRDLSLSKDSAIVISSLLFALIHIPIHFSIAQVIVSLVIGMLLGAMRCEFEDTIGIPSLAVAHALVNIF